MSARATTLVSDEGIWSPDGNRFIFESEGGLFLAQTHDTQAPEMLVKPDRTKRSPTSWSPDGRFVIYTTVNPTTHSDLWTLSLSSGLASASFLSSEAAESQGQFSPDAAGRLRVAYTSNASGRDDVLLRAFPDGTVREVVSKAGGHSPRWRGDGQELFYVAADGTLMAVPVVKNVLG